MERCPYVPPTAMPAASIPASPADERSYIIENLDRALRERWIQVYYQPIIRSANGLICDEEALSRWLDPVRGMLSPASFIPALEDARMIHKLDLYMVEQVLAHMKVKAETGIFIVPVSVNISRTDFEVCDIVDEIDRRVTAAGVRRELMNIEITESAFGKDPVYLKSQVDRFRALGYSVWMDDFGSGYSSLSLLQSFDFDLIKFDMSFLRQFHNDPKSRIILSALMKMMLMLGVDTVVEGVETWEHVHFLRGIGCDKLQGMYFNMPISFEELLRRHGQNDTLEFEDPRQANYYSAVGTANLNDSADLGDQADRAMRPFLQSVPMAVLELSDGTLRLLRRNTAYGEFLRSGGELPDDAALPEPPSEAFMQALRGCLYADGWSAVRYVTSSELPLQFRLRRLAVNPVTKALAVVAVVIAGL